METLFLIVIAFISTNVDDLFINLFFFARHRTKAEARSIAAGKYLGIGALTAISLLGAYGLQMLPDKCLSLLGLIPAGLGVREIIHTLRNQNSENDVPFAAQTLWLSVALITIANGADNIGVYLPLFAGFTPWQMGAAIIVFALMTGLWCLLAVQLAKLPAVQQVIRRWKRYLVPAVLFVLGISILLG